MEAPSETVETGLTAVYTEPAEPSVAVPVTAAVNLPALPATLTPFDLARLAREIAMDIKELSAILTVYNLTPAQYDVIKKHPQFKRMLESAIIDWNSALSTHDRIKVEAAAVLEDALPKLGARMTNGAESLAMQVEAGKLMAKLAGIGENTHGPQGGEKFTITINLGADKIQYERDAAPAAPQGSAGALPAIVEGKANPTEVQLVPQGN